MSWLRIDDGFTSHPKFVGWSAAQRWALLELMSYCARYRTDGHLPSDLSLLPRGVTAQLLTKARASGWLDEDDDGELWVHDWRIYNGGTTNERVDAYLDAHPDATANEVVKELGGNRKSVLAAVAEHRRAQRAPGSAPGSESGSNGGAEGGSKSGSESGYARAGPVPSPNTRASQQSRSELRGSAGLADDAVEDIGNDVTAELERLRSSTPFDSEGER